jgi:hypothetical protein
MRVVVLLPVLWVLASCVPMPQRVKDEFSQPDGERPNNFEVRRGQEPKE